GRAGRNRGDPGHGLRPGLLRPPGVLGARPRRGAHAHPHRGRRVAWRGGDPGATVDGHDRLVARPPAHPQAGGRRMSRTPRGRRVAARAQWRVIDAVVLGLAVALALLPLLPVYGARAAVPAIAGGVLLGAGMAVVAARRRWGAMVTCAV